MPSPSSIRPSGAQGRRSFAFVHDGETETGSGLLVGDQHRLARRDDFAMVASAIWLISHVIGIDAEITDVRGCRSHEQSLISVLASSSVAESRPWCGFCSAEHRGPLRHLLDPEEQL